MNDPLSRHTLEAKYRRSKILNGVLAAIVVFLGIVVVAQMLPGQSPTSSPTPAASETTGGEQATGGDMDFVRREAGDPKAIGDVDAPVVLTEWVDLRCPFCASFSRDTLPTLIEEYVDTGRVRIEFTDVAYFGAQSGDASVAAHAAANQDKYVDFLTAVFNEAPENGHADLTREVLIDFAAKVDMPDLSKFTADLDDPTVRARAEAKTATAQQLGVSAVPFFVAGKTAMSGAQPLDSFREYLDDALAKAE
ncbi:DsbA family protein [Dietzia alimentaria]|uniref:DsbA family protein n=1 Tax=Dietzia alimentaria TaxID=665550 RepID=UPI000299DF52|nr:thioredoxin domain-containing protein [Dietzia alimentaria]